MEHLLKYYEKNLKRSTSQQMFMEFYSTANLSPIDAWLELQFKNKVEKNDEESLIYKEKGTSSYTTRNFKTSLEYYTKSMRFATYGGIAYGTALSNRSATFYEMHDYENCIKDIDLCLNTEFPESMRPKLYLRKAKCLHALGQKENLGRWTEDTKNFLAHKTKDPESFLLLLNDINQMKIQDPLCEYHRNDTILLPDFKEGDKSTFASASSKLQLSSDEIKNRKVIAKEQIHKGDILFIEKAFSFAPIYTDKKDFSTSKCQHCLRDVIGCIPCHKCTLFVYCDEKCRISSWTNYHKWECEGMQANIWYELGVGLPAFRTALKGYNCSIATEDSQSCQNDAGYQKEGYKTFSQLQGTLYHIHEKPQCYIIVAVIIRYLEKYVGFSSNSEQTDKETLQTSPVSFGIDILQSISKLLLNSSVIEHWSYSAVEQLLPDVLTNIATGIFMSVSMMNHSCKPNITNYFIGDTIVVKALENIAENEEVLNCYGIDYRWMDKSSRQTACRELYYFDCSCIICQDPSKELNINNLLCDTCNGLIPDKKDTIVSYCATCDKDCFLLPYREVNNEAEKYLKSLDDDNVDELELLIKSLNIRKKILYKYHPDFDETYTHLYRCYLERADIENTLMYFNLWLEGAKYRRGENDRHVGEKLFETGLAALRYMQYGGSFKFHNFKTPLQNIERMISEGLSILCLYYPDYIMDNLNKMLDKLTKRN